MRLYAGQIITDEAGSKFVLVPYEERNSQVDIMPNDFDGLKIRDMRRKRGWTQAQLAKHAKITQATVSNIENEKETPHKPTLESLWAALNKI